MADGFAKNLKVSRETQEILSQIAIEVNAAYRENFQSLLGTLRDLAEGQKRLQVTLGILVRAIEPQLGKDLPVAVAIAMPREVPDIASAVVLADPAAAGFTWSQREVASKAGISAPEVSILTRAFRLDEDKLFAVKVKSGKRHVVLYRPEAAARLLELIAAPPVPLSDVAEATLKRVRRRLSQSK